MYKKRWNRIPPCPPHRGAQVPRTPSCRIRPTAERAPSQRGHRRRHRAFRGGPSASGGRLPERTSVLALLCLAPLLFSSQCPLDASKVLLAHGIGPRQGTASPVGGGGRRWRDRVQAESARGRTPRSGHSHRSRAPPGTHDCGEYLAVPLLPQDQRKRDEVVLDLSEFLTAIGRAYSGTRAEARPTMANSNDDELSCWSRLTSTIDAPTARARLASPGGEATAPDAAYKPHTSHSSTAFCTSSQR